MDSGSSGGETKILLVSNNSVAGSLKLFCAGQILRNTLLRRISSNIAPGSLEAECAFTQNSSQMFSLLARFFQVEELQASSERKKSTTWWCRFSLRIACACLRSLGDAIPSIIHALQSFEPRSGASSRSTELSTDNAGTNIPRALNFFSSDHVPPQTEASSSKTRNPMLCRVWSYFAPGLPSPTMR